MRKSLPLLGAVSIGGFALLLFVVCTFPEAFRVSCISTIDHASHCRSSK